MRITYLTLALLAVITSACTQADPAQTFYDHAESGTNWRLDVTGGTVAAPPYSFGCPIFASQTVHVPPADQLVQPNFDFHLNEYGDISTSYSVDGAFTQNIDGAVLSCDLADANMGQPGWCTWSGHDHCDYTFTATELP